MESTVRNLELIKKHLDLLPSEKQSIARWLSEEWRGGDIKLPRQLRFRIANYYNYDLTLPDAPNWLLRELSLELLATNKFSIARRNRLGANRHIPLGPKSVTGK